MPIISGKAVGITSGLPIPSKEGPRWLPIQFNFDTVTEETVIIDLDGKGMERVVGVFIDNSANPQGVTLEVLDTQWEVFIPANSQAMLPCVAPQAPRFSMRASSTGGVDVIVCVSNVEFQPNVWATITPGSIPGAVTVQGTVTTNQPLGAFTDRSATIAAGGVSQALAAANANRRGIIIYNYALAAQQGIAVAESIFINFGANAQVGTDSIEITPGGYFTFPPGVASNQAINVIAATTGHKFAAKEL